MNKQWGVHSFIPIHWTLFHLSSLASKSLYKYVPWLTWPSSLNSFTRWDFINYVPRDFTSMLLLYYSMSMFFISFHFLKERSDLTFLSNFPHHVSSHFCTENRLNKSHFDKRMWRYMYLDPCNFLVQELKEWKKEKMLKFLASLKKILSKMSGFLFLNGTFFFFSWFCRNLLTC